MEMILRHGQQHEPIESAVAELIADGLGTFVGIARVVEAGPQDGGEVVEVEAPVTRGPAAWPSPPPA